MGRNLASFCDIDVTAFPQPVIKIILPGTHHQTTQKFIMPK